MKPILEWLNEAKEQGYKWADVAIKNYNPNYATVKGTESLKEALLKAFSWKKSLEGHDYWGGIYETLSTTTTVNNSAASVSDFCDAAQISVGYDQKQDFANIYIDYEGFCATSMQKPLSKAAFSMQLKNIGYIVQKGAHNKTFVWYSLRGAELGCKAPSPTTLVNPTVLEAMIEDLEKLNKALENLEHNETLKEPYRTQVYEATKASYEEQLAEVKAKIAKSLGIEPVKERKLIGWVVQNEDGGYSRYTAPVVTKANYGWVVTKGGGWSGITPEQIIALCGRLPKWSDDEPIPIYE